MSKLSATILSAITTAIKPAAILTIAVLGGLTIHSIIQHEVVRNDVIEDSSNSKNASAAVRKYVNTTNIESDGTITLDKTISE